MTAEELLKNKIYITKDGQEDVHDSLTRVKDIMIQFAKYHVEQCKKSVRIIDDPNSYTGNTGSEYPPDQVIFINYPLENIK